MSDSSRTDSGNPDQAQTTANKNTAIDTDPTRSLEEARNANEGKSDNGSGSVASSTAEDYVPSRSDPEASDLPSANTSNSGTGEPL